MTQFGDIKGLISTCAGVIAESAPSGWVRIVYYAEFAKLDDDVDQVSITSCVDSAGRKLDLLPPFEIELLLREAFESQASDASPWTGLKLQIDAGGRYGSRFYYGPPPRISGDVPAAKQRVRADDF